MKQKIDNILFNGYVREPIPIVIIASIVGIAALVFAVWSSIGLFIPSTTDTHETKLYFIEYIKDGPIYSLTASDGYLYDIPQKAVDESSLLDRLIEEQFLVLVEYSSCSGEVDSFDIVSLSTLEGYSIISSDIISEARSTDAKISSIIMWTSCILYWTFISASYYFISNAPKHPRIASFLVRESFRNF